MTKLSNFKPMAQNVTIHEDWIRNKDRFRDLWINVSRLIDDAKADVKNIDGSITGIEGSITSIEVDVASIETDLASVNIDISVIQDDINGINSAIASIETRVTSTEGDIASAELVISSNTSAITGNTTAIASLTTRVNTAEGDIASAEITITSLESDVGALESEIYLSATVVSGSLTRVTGIRIGTSDTESDIEFQSDTVRFVDGGGTPRIYYDLVAGKYIFDGTIYVENIEGDSIDSGYLTVGSAINIPNSTTEQLARVATNSSPLSRVLVIFPIKVDSVADTCTLQLTTLGGSVLESTTLPAGSLNTPLIVRDIGTSAVSYRLRITTNASGSCKVEPQKIFVQVCPKLNMSVLSP